MYHKNYILQIQFGDSARFTTSSFQNFVKNFAVEIHNIKCKNERNKKCETCENKYKDCGCSHIILLLEKGICPCK